LTPEGRADRAIGIEHDGQQEFDEVREMNVPRVVGLKRLFGQGIEERGVEEPVYAPPNQQGERSLSRQPIHQTGSVHAHLPQDLPTTKTQKQQSLPIETPPKKP